VLAQLNTIPGVAEVCVDVTGRLFRIVPRPGSDPSRIVSHILAVLGSESRFLRDPGIRLDSGDDELWLNSGNIRTLSHIEARLLSERWGSEAARHARLDPDTALAMRELLRAELMQEFDRVHKEGGTDDRIWYRNAFPAAFERTLLRLAPITPEQAKAVKDSLFISLGHQLHPSAS